MSKEESMKRVAREIAKAVFENVPDCGPYEGIELAISDISPVLTREFGEILALAKNVSQAHGPHYCGSCSDSIKLRAALERLERP